MSIIKLVKNQKVYFISFKKNNLWYKTEKGFEFPVPISDTGDGVFLNEDKAIRFMRYIRVHLNNIKKGQLECSN